jgi:predicted RNA-binding protein with PUA-like domain
MAKRDATTRPTPSTGRPAAPKKASASPLAKKKSAARTTATRAAPETVAPTLAQRLVPPRSDPKAPRYWLMKSEPDVYSIDDLARDGSTAWEGVRNYTARNFMRDEMALGDRILFYHSNAEPPGIAGLAEVVGLAEADATQFDPKSEYFDAGATRDAPRWLAVRVGFVSKLPRLVPLDVLKADRSLDGMLVVAKGQRLSVQPVLEAHYRRVLALV